MEATPCKKMFLLCVTYLYTLCFIDLSLQSLTSGPKLLRTGCDSLKYRSMMLIPKSEQLQAVNSFLMKTFWDKKKKKGLCHFRCEQTFYGPFLFDQKRFYLYSLWNTLVTTFTYFSEIVSRYSPHAESQLHSWAASTGQSLCYISWMSGENLKRNRLFFFFLLYLIRYIFAGGEGGNVQHWRISLLDLAPQTQYYDICLLILMARKEQRLYIKVKRQGCYVPGLYICVKNLETLHYTQTRF